MSAKKSKNSVTIRKDTPMATSIASFPKTPYHPEKEEKEEKPKRKMGFDLFRRKVKTNLTEKSTTQWNLSTLLKSTLPSMTKDIIIDNDFKKGL